MEKVLAKTFAIVETMLESKAPCGVTELARTLGLAKSNVHRLLNSLIELDLVRQVPDSEKYELTLKLWRMGARILAQTDIRNIAESYMMRLCDITREDIYLSVLENTQVYYIRTIQSNRVVRVTHGSANPAYSSSTGKAILAWSSIKQVDACLDGAVRFTEDTITDRSRFLEELMQIRRRGYSLNRGEWRPSVRGVAAPIFDTDGHCIAAIGISGPAPRMSLEYLEELAPHVCATAAKISQQLGYMPVYASPELTCLPPEYQKQFRINEPDDKQANGEK